jgi:hypothetical protein
MKDGDARTEQLDATPAVDGAVAPAAPDACLNCGEPFGHPPPRYCPACGQQSNVRPPTLLEFAQQFGDAYLAAEGALWRTLKLLVVRPGELTRQYLAGRRRHYVLPLRLYLTISVVVLLLLRTLASANMEQVAQWDVDLSRSDFTVLDLGRARVGMRQGVFFCEQLPGWLCRRAERRLAADGPGPLAQLSQLGERVVSNLGTAMFVLLPAFALALKAVYRSRRLRYTEHLVFALHVHAFWFLVLAAAMLSERWLGDLLLLAVPVYALMAMRRVYDGRWWPLLLRAALVSVLYGALLLIASVAVVVWSWLS